MEIKCLQIILKTSNWPNSIRCLQRESGFKRKNADRIRA